MGKSDDFYSSSGKEINLRNEFNNTIYGSTQEIPKGQKGLLRKFTRDSFNKLIPCYCVSSVTGEPDKESRCSSCLGEGNIWIEEYVEFYHARVSTESSFIQDNLYQPGMLNTQLEIFYISSSFNLTKDDKIVLLTLDKQGLSSLIRARIFRISELRDMRLDDGKLEFWKAFTYEDDTKFL